MEGIDDPMKSKQGVLLHVTAERRPEGPYLAVQCFAGKIAVFVHTDEVPESNFAFSKMNKTLGAINDINPYGSNRDDYYVMIRFDSNKAEEQIWSPGREVEHLFAVSPEFQGPSWGCD